MRHGCALITALLLSMNGTAEVRLAIAIKDARVVTVSSAELPKATVLLRDGLIEDVGPNLNIPADAWVIDGTGLTVYPGLIDGLSTWGIPAPARAPTTQETPAKTPPVPRSNGPEDRPQTYSFQHAADLVSATDRRFEVVMKGEAFLFTEIPMSPT